MSRSKRAQGNSGKDDRGKKQHAQYRYATMTEHEFATLKSVLTGYLGFLRNLATNELEWSATLVRVQAVRDRLPEHPETSDVPYFFSYEERLTILEAVIAFQFLLVTTFPQTAQRERALADVERLYQCLMSAQSLPLN